MCFSKWALNIHLLLYIHASKGGWPPPNVFLSGSSDLSKSDETLLVGGKGGGQNVLANCVAKLVHLLNFILK